MRAHVIKTRPDGRKVVENTIVMDDFSALPDWHIVAADFGGEIGDFYDENTNTFTPPDLTVAPTDPEAWAALVREYDGHVQARLDAHAAAMGYGDPNRPEVSPILHAITYADEAAVPKFQAEGRALRAWRSLYWAACWPVLEAVRLGQRPVPTPAELLAELDAAAPPPVVA